MSPPFQSFAEFYPFFLERHSNRTNRRLHLLSFVTLLAVLAFFALTLNWWLVLTIPVAGYGFSWLGHFVFERNKPTAFGHPFYSIRADLTMLKDMLTGKIKL